MRDLPDAEADGLKPGADHYRAYVGPPDQYDLMGATQFSLLVTLGLRGRHRLLDFGCGSLRAGRLLIPYLDVGNYYGIEPNEWLVETGMRRQLGIDIVETKRPHFFAFKDFRADQCGTVFDFIVAQSIFSHAGPDLIAITLAGFRASLADDGLVLVTVLHPERTGGLEHHGEGWFYPSSISYAPTTFQRLIADSGLVGRSLPWFHPRQTWYVLAHHASNLPSAAHDIHLRGAILRTPDWRDSLHSSSP